MSYLGLLSPMSATVVGGYYMTSRGFYQFVDDHPKLEWWGAVEGAARVRCNETGHFFEFPFKTIQEEDQDVLEAIALGQRPARIMTHVTRIVGYYSQLHNWNPSKIAELHDRHKGNYDVV
jgi:hypothetical protein